MQFCFMKLAQSNKLFKSSPVNGSDCIVAEHSYMSVPCAIMFLLAISTGHWTGSQEQGVYN